MTRKLRVRLIAIVAAVLLAIPASVLLYYQFIGNPRAFEELLADPQGERAQIVMLLTLPSGRRIPVNYLREGDRVYAAADGRWWRELVGEGVPVSVYVRGETLPGMARAVVDEPDYTQRVFARLRPDAVPGFGTLIEVRLQGAEASTEH
jgi:hypothetical protein